MIKNIFQFLMQTSSLKFIIVAIVLALSVWPIEDKYPTLFILGRLFSFLLLFFALVKLSIKK